MIGYNAKVVQIVTQFNKYMKDCSYIERLSVSLFILKLEAFYSFNTNFMIQPIQTAQFISDSGGTPQCESHCLVNLDQIQQLHPEMLPLEKAQQMAEFFGTLADPTRLRLLSLLATKELCVCDLATILKMSESAVSHQLRVLRAQRLVRYRKEGRNVHYSLADNHVINLYREVAEHLNETS